MAAGRSSRRISTVRLRSASPLKRETVSFTDRYNFLPCLLDFMRWYQN